MTLANSRKIATTATAVRTTTANCCGDFEELKCPACGESIYLDPDAIPEDHLIVCPSCNREIEVKVEEAE